MKPRLITISGPAMGQTLPLTGERFTIGRQADNDLQLVSPEISRHHCELRRGPDGRYTLLNLDSRHGVFVNNRPVGERRLAHTDLVTVGTSLLLFLLDDPAPSTAAPDLQAAAFVANSTVAMKPTEVFYLDPGRVETALPAQARIARDLHALLRLSEALQGPLSMAQLAANLLGTVLEMVPVDRATVLLCEPGVVELTPVATRARDQGTIEAGLAPSRAVLDQVLGEKVGILCEGTGWLLCSPLLDRDGEVLGVIYGDKNSSAALEERHLDLLGAIAGIASPAFQNTLHLSWMARENRRLQDHQLRGDMIGESAPMRKLFDLIGRVAQTDTTVMIRGESGTGKELVAQAIHRSSPRADGPFVAVNCATLSATLLESELFGHEKGAFTGAVERAIGKVEAAQGGTFFLDEVGEIPPPLQAKLLRVLQEREFQRVGGARAIRADVRVIAATNRDLETAITDGGFRQDLYYRLKVITLETPPLRQRRGDIPLLASHFLASHAGRLSRRGVGISPAARRCLMAYLWPGNVRELENVIERALVLGETDVVQPEDLPEEVIEGSAEMPGEFLAAIAETKKKLILKAWRQADGDYTSCARILGVHVNSLHRMISRLGLREQLDR